MSRVTHSAPDGRELDGATAMRIPRVGVGDSVLESRAALGKSPQVYQNNSMGTVCPKAEARQASGVTVGVPRVWGLGESGPSAMGRILGWRAIYFSRKLAASSERLCRI